MSYDVGIDVGTTFTAAAIMRGGAVEPVALTTSRVTVPSVLFAARDEMLFGGAAERRGAAQPGGLAREFKRRLGDPVPLMLSGSPYHADRLTALMARWVADTVEAQLGGPPGAAVFTHPANWTEYQLDALRKALADVGLEHAELISEPAAAAIDYAAVAHVVDGAALLVYDLGGGTFDVALLRRDGARFEHVVEPAGIERLGGIDFDEAVFHYAVARIPRDVLERARHHPEGTAGITQLQRRCVEAKEALSSDSSADIPVLLPNHTSTIQISRSELEAMIRPSIERTIELVQRTIDRAGIDTNDLQATLLVGGSSRIPLVSQLVAQQLGVPVRIDSHPKLVTARGAARLAGDRSSRSRSGTSAAPAGATALRRRPWVLPVGAAAVFAIGATAFLALRPSSADVSPPDIAIVGLIELPLSAPADIVTEGTTAWVSDARGVYVVDLTGEREPAHELVSSGVAHNLDLGPDSVWITRESRVDELDRRTSTIRQRIDLELVPNDVLALAGRVWLSDFTEGGLWYVDTVARPPRAVAVLEPGVLTADLATAGEAVWVAQTVADRVVRLDPTSGDTTTFEVSGCGPTGIDVSGDAVWLACSTSRTVRALDATNGAGELVIGASGDLGTPWGIVADDGGAWVTDRAGGLVSYVSVDGEVRSVDLGEPLDAIVAAQPTGVLVATTDGLVRVDFEREG